MKRKAPAGAFLYACDSLMLHVQTECAEDAKPYWRIFTMGAKSFRSFFVLPDFLK